MASTPYGSNTYVPSPKATGGMLVGYSRNIDKFPLNRYAELKPVSNDVGLYRTWNSREAGRILSTDDREHMWADGQDAPHGRDELESFSHVGYRTTRRVYPYTLGDLGLKQADWPVLQAHAAVAGQKMMTARTLLAQQALSTASWSSVGHLVGVNGGLLVKGQGWDNGTATAPNILNTLNYCAALVHRDTLGAVDPDSLILVVGVDIARKMAASPEVHQYIANSPDAKGRLLGSDKKTMNRKRYGLPDEIYGYPIVIEDTVRVTSSKGATDALSFVMPSTEAYLVSRPGGLVGLEGTPAFSTLTGFFYEESTSEIKNDPDNRRTRGRVVTNYQYQVVSTLAGVKLTDILKDDSSGI